MSCFFLIFIFRAYSESLRNLVGQKHGAKKRELQANFHLFSSEHDCIKYIVCRVKFYFYTLVFVYFSAFPVTFNPAIHLVLAQPFPFAIPYTVSWKQFDNNKLLSQFAFRPANSSTKKDFFSWNTPHYSSLLLAVSPTCNTTLYRLCQL